MVKLNNTNKITQNKKLIITNVFIKTNKNVNKQTNSIVLQAKKVKKKHYTK